MVLSIHPLYAPHSETKKKTESPELVRTFCRAGIFGVPVFDSVGQRPGLELGCGAVGNDCTVCRPGVDIFS